MCSFNFKILAKSGFIGHPGPHMDQTDLLPLENKQNLHGELPKHKIQVLYWIIQEDTWIFSKYFLLLTVGFMSLFVVLVKWISWEMTWSSRTCWLLISSKIAEKVLQETTPWLTDGEDRFWKGKMTNSSYLWCKLLGALQSADCCLVLALWGGPG